MKGGYLLEGIRLENVRSLKDTEMVPLSPITLLVGENSSGKSTFLRVFPLIKQSIGKRTAGPLLWAGGEGDYVDFGSFGETVTNDGSKTMSFHFVIPLSACLADNSSFSISNSLYSYPIRLKETSRVWEPNTKATYSITLTHTGSATGGREYVSRLRVAVGTTSFELNFPPKKAPRTVKIDGISLDLNNKNTPKGDEHFLIERPLYVGFFDIDLPSINDLQKKLWQRFFPEEIAKGQNGKVLSEKFLFADGAKGMRAATIIMGELLTSGMDLEEIQEFSDVAIRDRQSKVIYNRLKAFTEQLRSCGEEESRQLTASLKFCFLHACVSSLDRYLYEYFQRVHYIAPLRATAERYYRLRNLAIDEVDYQGKNLAIFLNGLQKERLEQFEKWTSEQFGFKVIPTTDGAHHLAVQISANKRKPVNMTDTGFGYSQILPIITQLWDLSTRPNTRSRMGAPLVVAIEQPELHLHPALQARLAKAFIACLQLAQSNGYRLQLLLETHSQTIVNYFGRAIARGMIKQDNVSVVVFNRSSASEWTDTCISHYDEEGFLTNWPSGFFDAEE